MYTSETVAIKIKELAKQRTMSIKQVLSTANLGSNTMANMKTSMPKADSLARIADALGCSVDYLLGRSSVESMPEDMRLSDTEANLLMMIRNMNEEGQEKIVSYAHDLERTGQYKKADSVGLVEKEA